MRTFNYFSYSTCHDGVHRCKVIVKQLSMNIVIVSYLLKNHTVNRQYSSVRKSVTASVDVDVIIGDANNVPLDTRHIIGHFVGRFYRSDDPTNSVIALKDDSLPGQGPIPRLSTLMVKKKCNKFFSTYSTKYTEDTEVLGRQLSQERSKPDPVDRVRTAHYIGVHMMCTIMMHNSTELVK